MKTHHRKTRHLSAALLVLSALTFSATTLAQERGQHRGELRKLDTNRDKMISKAEAANHPMLSQNFDKIDANKDGQLSRDELQAFQKANKVDQDGDGNISRAEAEKNPQLAKNFDVIDANKDGVITPAERQAWMQAHRGQMKKS
jgi:Ca2+-binding EF-hand superfamily protein